MLRAWEFESPPGQDLFSTFKNLFAKRKKRKGLKAL